MRVAIAFDHAGLPLKETVIQAVQDAGQEVLDLGAFSVEPGDDYPVYAKRIGEAILAGKAERGVLVCGSGIGACIAANKIRGIYASIAHEDYSAAQGVEHDNMNVLCLGARVIGVEIAAGLVHAFLGARFSTEERHRRRVGEIREIEKNSLVEGKE